MQQKARCKTLRFLGAAAVLLQPALAAPAQISLSTAVNLALGNDARVKLAQADLAKARAQLSESKEAFVPSVAAVGGVGKSTGAPLSPPVVFSIAAQSLVYSVSQPDYIRAARAGVEAAQLALDAARSDVAEDVASTCVTLDNAQERRTAQTQAMSFAARLVHITDERFQAGVDPHMDLTKARRTAAQLRLQQLLVEDEVATQTEHLARLTGLSPHGLGVEHDSIPALRDPASAVVGDFSGASRENGISAAFSAARAKQLTAHADRHYLFRPQVAFTANYARISTAFTNYTQYYPRFGASGNSFNSLSVGVQITLPLLDMIHRAKTHEEIADAAHSLAEAQLQQGSFLEGRSKLRHTAAELLARRELAALEHDLSEDQLQVVGVRLRAAAGELGGEQSNPKDEVNARLDERQRTVDMLNAALQLSQTEVMLMRQEGTLVDWLATSLGGSRSPASASPTPSTSISPTLAPSPNTSSPGVAIPLPATSGSAPMTSSPATSPSTVAPGGEPATAPTTGTPPATLPSSPVTTPTAPPSGSSTPSFDPHP